MPLKSFEESFSSEPQKPKMLCYSEDKVGDNLQLHKKVPARLVSLLLLVWKIQER